MPVHFKVLQRISDETVCYAVRGRAYLRRGPKIIAKSVVTVEGD